MIYNLLFSLWVFAIFPRIFQKKYRKNLLFRLGIKKPHIPRKRRKRVWIHAVSLGETKAVGPLIEKLRKEQSDVEIFLSTGTETGQCEAKQKPVDYCFYLPLDFPFLMKKLVKKVSADLFILVETDFWCNMLKELKKHGTKIVLVNGKISEKSYKKFRRFPKFSKKLFGTIDLFCLQNNEYERRFLELGVSKTKVTGNLKFDIPRTIKRDLTLHLPKAYVTVACTHENEEEMILDALKKLDVCLLIAPRHPERFSKVAKMLEKRGIAFRSVADQDRNEKVVLIDRMGVLDQCYENSLAAIMGGSFISTVGGHNIYEPARLGIPVIYGPHMYKQPDLVYSLKKHNIGKQVELQHLQETLSHYLQSKPDLSPYARLKNEMEGATEKTYNLIKQL